MAKRKQRGGWAKRPRATIVCRVDPLVAAWWRGAAKRRGCSVSAMLEKWLAETVAVAEGAGHLLDSAAAIRLVGRDFVAAGVRAGFLDPLLEAMAVLDAQGIEQAEALVQIARDAQRRLQSGGSSSGSGGDDK